MCSSLLRLDCVRISHLALYKYVISIWWLIRYEEELSSLCVIDNFFCLLFSSQTLTHTSTNRFSNRTQKNMWMWFVLKEWDWANGSVIRNQIIIYLFDVYVSETIQCQAFVCLNIIHSICGFPLNIERVLCLLLVCLSCSLHRNFKWNFQSC